MSCLTSIHVLIFATHLHPGDVSAPSRSLELHLNSIHVQSQNHPDFKMCVSSYPGLVSFASRSQDSCISSFNVLSLLHPGPEKCKSTQFRPISNSFWSQDVCFTCIHVLPHQLPGPKIFVSSPSMYRLISIQVQRFLSHLHPCTVPLPPG